MNAPFPAPTTSDLRAKLEAAVERLLAILDELEADPDLEPGDNEDGCAYEDQPPPWYASDEDNEPSLGSIENHFRYYGDGPDRGITAGRIGDQTHWSAGSSDDLEEEADGSEPSLGWTATIKQVGFGWTGGLDDAEGEHDGREPEFEDHG